MTPLLVKLGFVLVLLVLVRAMHWPIWLGFPVMVLGGYLIGRAVDQTGRDDWE